MKRSRGRPRKPDGEGVVKMTISVPPMLRAMMGSVCDRVNWSAVAAEAFRRKLSELKRQRDTKSSVKLDDVGHLAFI